MDSLKEIVQGAERGEISREAMQQRIAERIRECSPEEALEFLMEGLLAPDALFSQKGIVGMALVGFAQNAGGGAAVPLPAMILGDLRGIGQKAAAAIAMERFGNLAKEGKNAE